MLSNRSRLSSLTDRNLLSVGLHLYFTIDKFSIFIWTAYLHMFIRLLFY